MNSILHVEIPASDLARAIAFYQQWLRVDVDAPILLHDCQMAYLPFSDDAEGASMALVQGADYRPSEQGARLGHPDERHLLGESDLDRGVPALARGVEKRLEALARRRERAPSRDLGWWGYIRR